MRPDRAFPGPLFPLSAALVLVAACGGSPTPSPGDAAKPGAKMEAVETPAGASATVFTVASEDAEVGFTMQAPFEKQDGGVPADAVSGELQVDLAAFSRSTGLVNVRIDGLALYMQKAADDGVFGERVLNEQQNAHMREWLEIGESAPAEEREKNSLAQFAIERIEDASVQDLRGLTGAERRVTFTGVGKFRLHQRSSDHRVALAATFTFDGDRATALRIETVEPVTLDLESHDVRPRRGFGVLADKTLAAMSSKVAREAQVSVSFTARPAPR